MPKLNVAVIVASTREGRHAPVVAEWLLGEMADRPHLAPDVVDLAEIDLPARMPSTRHPDVDALRRRIDQADAFIVVTPEYNHSYPASLKHAVDLVGAEWRRKPVAFVSYGGISGGLRAVEHLRGVFAELQAVAIRETVSFHGPWSWFGPDGRPVDTTSSRRAVTAMLDDLAWWATTLQRGRVADLASVPA